MLPEGVTAIGTEAFYQCVSLRSITLPEGLTWIEEQLFAGCDSLTSVVIPEGVTGIGWQAFYGCDSLRSVQLPSSLISVDDSAFQDCKNLSEIWVSPENPHFGTVDGVVFDHKNHVLVFYPANMQQSRYCVPQGTTGIGTGAFNGNAKLKEIVIPGSMTWIGYDNDLEDVQLIFEDPDSELARFTRGEW